MVGISVGKGEVNCVGMGEGSKELSAGLDTGERVALSKGSLVLFTGVTTSEEVILPGHLGTTITCSTLPQPSAVHTKGWVHPRTSNAASVKYTVFHISMWWHYHTEPHTATGHGSHFFFRAACMMIHQSNTSCTPWSLIRVLWPIQNNTHKQSPFRQALSHSLN